MFKPIIMTGNFSMVPPLVAKSVMEKYGHHRDVWFQGILEEIVDYFVKIFGPEYQPLILASTLEGGYEAIASNFLSSTTTVFLSAESIFKEYASIWGGENIIFNPLSEEFNFKVNQAETTLVFLDHVSSAAQVIDLDQVSKKFKQSYTNCLLVADISTSFGADQCDFSSAIDAYIISPEKALMGIPGLSVVVIKKSVLKKLSENKNISEPWPFLFDLVKANSVWENKKTTPYSPNISAVVALDTSLKLLGQTGGLKQHLERHKAWADFLRSYLIQCGFKILNPQKTTNAFTICEAPKNVSALILADTLYQQGVVIRLNHAANNSLIIGHLGYLSHEIIIEFIKKFNQALNGLISVSSFNSSFDLMNFFPENQVGLNQGNLSSYPFKKRTIGLVGSEDKIREIISLCKKVGFENFIVYRPFLKIADNYWQQPGIVIVNSIKELVLECHTALFLPLHSDVQELIGKSLFSEIEASGKMDVLIDASGQLKLFNSRALDLAVKNGWLKYFKAQLGTDKKEMDEILDCILNSVEDKLLTPGPTRFNPKVFQVMDRYIYHNTPQFQNDFNSLNNKMMSWFGAHNPILIHAVPSTGFMEAAVSNLTSCNERGLVISHGKFGDRFIEIGKAKKRSISFLKKEVENWGQCFSAKEIGDFFKKDLLAKPEAKISFICFQQNETSSGVAYRQKHIKDIVKIARAYNVDIIIIVDAVSGFFAHDLHFDKSGVDCLIVGSQKGLGISSGLSFMALSDRAIRRLLSFAGYGGDLENFCRDNCLNSCIKTFNARQKVCYLSLLRLLADVKNHQFSFNQNIFHIYSALKSLNIIENTEGKKGFIKRHAKLAKLVRQCFVKQLQVSLFGSKAYYSDSVTLSLFTDSTDAEKLKRDLHDFYGISVGGAQSDYWKKRVIRIGHFGYVYEADINHFLRAVRLLIKK